MHPAEFFMYAQILGSFNYLKVPSKKGETDPMTPLTIILYPGLEEDYADFLVAYAEKTGKEKEKAKDPKSPEIKEKLHTYCKHILHAKQYEYGNKNLHHRFKVAVDDIPNVEEADYKGITVTVGNYNEVVAMFLCFEEDDGTKYYITYGFTEDYAFVFQKRGRRSPPVLFGIAEPTPVIDESFRNRRHLEKVFAQIHRTYKAKHPDSHPICTLNVNQKIRLCSLIDNARSSLAQQVPSAFGYRDEIKRVQTMKCEEKVVVTFENLDTEVVYQHVPSVTVTPYPCFITFYQKAVVDFLIIEDPSDHLSVFLLERIQFKRSNNIKVLVVGRIRQIALLKYANEIF